MSNEIESILKVKGYRFILNQNLSIDMNIVSEIAGVVLPELTINTIGEYIRALADETSKLDNIEGYMYVLPISVLMFGSLDDRDYFAEKIGFDNFGKFIYATFLMSENLYTTRFKEGKPFPESLTLLTKKSVFDVNRVAYANKQMLLNMKDKGDRNVYLANLKCCTKLENAVADFFEFHKVSSVDGINLIPERIEVLK